VIRIKSISEYTPFAPVTRDQKNPIALTFSHKTDFMALMASPSEIFLTVIS
jgi:predicted NodU family carbamoyl transferase